jgi:hypothetical protein
VTKPETVDETFVTRSGGTLTGSIDASIFFLQEKNNNNNNEVIDNRETILLKGVEFIAEILVGRKIYFESYVFK